MPIAVDESSPSPPPNPLSNEGNAALEPRSSPPLEVWLLEDNPGDVFIVREVLKQAGLHLDIRVSADGEEALSFLKRLDADQNARCPAIILLDLNLPRVSGAEVLMSVRRHARCNQVPVIVLTSSDSPLDLAAIEQGGASAYFRKPTNFTAYLELGNMIRNILPAAGKHQ
jgi:CheY-like chemotaxis protein